MAPTKKKTTTKSRVRKKRPRVASKSAMSLDGRIAKVMRRLLVALFEWTACSEEEILLAAGDHIDAGVPPVLPWLEQDDECMEFLFKNHEDIFHLLTLCTEEGGHASLFAYLIAEDERYIGAFTTTFPHICRYFVDQLLVEVVRRLPFTDPPKDPPIKRVDSP